MIIYIYLFAYCFWASFFNTVVSFQDVKSFAIGRDDTGINVVQTQLGDGAIGHCSINFTTSTTWRRRTIDTDTIFERRDRQSKKPTTQDALNQLKGTCRVFKKGFWSYKFCFGKSIEQIHRGGVGFFFGRKAQPLISPTAKSQTYTDGDECGTSGRAEKRKAIVTYLCGKGFQLIGVSETSTCTYSLVVKLPGVCGAEGFPLIASSGYSTVKTLLRGVSIRHAFQQNWYMEITSFDDGESLECQIYRLADENVPFEKVYFKDFSVGVWTTSETKQPYFFYKSHRARGLNQQLLDKEEFTIENEGEGKGKVVLVQPQPQFTGNIESFKIILSTHTHSRKEDLRLPIGFWRL